MELKQCIENGLLMSSSFLNAPNNTPAAFSDRQKQYYEAETSAFNTQYAKYSSDYISAQIQGLHDDAPLQWETVCIRMADVVRPSAAMGNRFDDYKIILVANKNISYIPLGCKIVAMGSTWLSINPANISSSDGIGIVQRCNAVWNYLDWYGNVCSEPICIEKLLAASNDSDAQKAEVITKGYFNLKCQYNKATAQLNTNSRMILGSASYRITGYSDFFQEFTGDYNSIRLMAFTIRYEEPSKEIDDMKRHVAGGKLFSWNIEITGQPAMKVSETAVFSATSFRNGETVESAPDYPVTYLWSSSNESVATVDDQGTVQALSEGNCAITATLAQNNQYLSSFAITVAGDASEPRVSFLNTVPKSVKAYRSITLSAAYFEQGSETGLPISWSFSGADSTSYSVITKDNQATISAWKGSVTPLTVTAFYGNSSVNAVIRLEGI